MVVPGTEPDSSVRVPLLRQSWRAVTFVHWQVDPAAVRSRLPADVTVDEHSGTAWLTLVVLSMEGLRFAGLPPLPRMAAFCQTNLRTYVTGPGGKRGIWFFSLDAANLAFALGARALLGAPYYPADLAVHRDPMNAGLRYSGWRLVPRGRAAYRMSVLPGEHVEPDGLDVWLTHRWRAFTRRAGRTLEIPVHHGRWRLRRAVLRELDETVTSAAGLLVGEPVRVQWSGGMDDVVFGFPELHRTVHRRGAQAPGTPAAGRRSTRDGGPVRPRPDGAQRVTGVRYARDRTALNA